MNHIVATANPQNVRSYTVLFIVENPNLTKTLKNLRHPWNRVNAHKKFEIPSPKKNVTTRYFTLNIMHLYNRDKHSLYEQTIPWKNLTEENLSKENHGFNQPIQIK